MSASGPAGAGGAETAGFRQRPPSYNTRAMPPLDSLVTTRLPRFPPARQRALFRAVEAAERVAELFPRHRAGLPARPHPIALTPFLVHRRAVPGLARLADLVHRLQAHAPRLW